MYRFIGFIAAAVIAVAAVPSAQQPSAGGPYKVVKSARVGGEGGWDYIYADADGRRSVYRSRRGGGAIGSRSRDGL